MIRKYKVTVAKPTWVFLKGVGFNIHHKLSLKTYSVPVAVRGTRGESLSQTDPIPDLTELAIETYTPVEIMKLTNRCPPFYMIFPGFPCLLQC